MFRKFLQISLAALVLTVASGAVNSAWAQTVTVVEYYNKALDAFFITGRAAEQQQLDTIPDFRRTGMTFQAAAASAAPVGSTRVCRFYVASASPFTNSHFYGREGVDCEAIRAQNLPGFKWEDYDFALEQPVGGVCSANKTAIYRSFRPNAGGKTANHRYSASYDSYVLTTGQAYNGESVALCAAAATDVTQPLVSAACGTFYYPRVRVSYQSMNSDGLAASWVRSMGATEVTFNGLQAQPVTDQYSSGAIKTVMIDETPSSWTELGYVSQDSAGVVQTYFSPPTLFSRQAVTDQRTDFDRYAIYNPIQSFGSPKQVGQITLVGKETIEVPAGTYATCKFSGQITTDYTAIGRTDVRRTTTWVSAGVGVVRSDIQDTTTSGFGPTFPVTSTSVTASSVQRL